jgi:hypothetical protein
MENGGKLSGFLCGINKNIEIKIKCLNNRFFY